MARAGVVPVRGRRGVLGERRRLPHAAAAPAGAGPSLHHGVAQRRLAGVVF